MPRSTLLVHLGALGDLLLSLPTIRYIRHGTDRVVLAGRSPQTPFLAAVREVDEALDAGGSLWLPLFSGEVREDLRGLLTRFDRVVCFSRGAAPAIANGLALLDREPEVIVTSPPSRRQGSVAGHQLRQVMGEVPTPDPLLHPLDLRSSGPPQAASERPVIAVHPGSGGPRKCWPWPSYREAIRRVHGLLAAHWLLIVGPSEPEALRLAVRAMVSGLGSRTATLLEDEPLPRLARHLARSRLYIGNDAGVGHLAAWCGVPTVLLFGPTDPVRWAPPLPWVRSVQTDLFCAPCEGGYRDCETPKCMDHLTVEDVVDEVLEGFQPVRGTDDPGSTVSRLRGMITATAK